MTERVQQGSLQIARELADLVANEIAPGTGIEVDAFWAAFEKILTDLAPKNRVLLTKRDELQAKIDNWHQARHGQPHEPAAYKAFLQEIGYLQPTPAAFNISTQDVDNEIATQAGPQLVVPVMNARFALNASNARWGSLYDALYGSDAISEADGAQRAGGYNPARGAKVIAFARNLLNQAAPLAQGDHSDSTGYAVVGGQLEVTLTDGSTTGLANPEKFIGYTGTPDTPASILLKNNALHIDIQIDRSGAIGQTDAAGIQDLVLESAITTIMDCEDSVAAVDAEDKTLVYRNWLGLMKGNLAETFQKGDRTLTRKMNPDREYTAADGSSSNFARS